MQPEHSLSTNATSGQQIASTVPTSGSLAPTLGVIVVAGLALFGTLTALFPLHTPAPELLVAMPPPEISIARESALSLGRLINPLIALTTFAFVLAMVIPLVSRSYRSPAPGIAQIALWAVVAALLTAVGIAIGWGFGEFVSLPSDYSMLKPIIGHSFVIGLFSAGVCMAVGAYRGGKADAGEHASRGFLFGLIAAIAMNMLASMAPRMSMETLLPGGPIWGKRDPIALGIFISVLLLAVLVTLVGVGRKSKAVA